MQALNDFNEEVINKNGRIFVTFKCSICNNSYTGRKDGNAYKRRRCRPCSRIAQKEKVTKHGYSKKRDISPIYRRWDCMIQRCTNNNTRHYHAYGGRGIKVCEEWLDFKNFLNDMGDSFKEELTLDRIDNNKGYYKHNCRWVSMKEQQNNRRTNRIFIFNEVKKTARQWSDYFNIDWNTVKGRINRGWDALSAFNTPVNQNIWKRRN